MPPQEPSVPQLGLHYSARCFYNLCTLWGVHSATMFCFAQRPVEHVKNPLQNIMTEWTPHSVNTSNLLALDVTLGLELLDVFYFLDRLAMVDTVRAIVRVRLCGRLCVHGRGEGRGHGETEDESKRPHDDGVLFGE